MRSFQLEKLNLLRSSSAIANIESVSPTLSKFDRRIGISLAAAIADREDGLHRWRSRRRQN
ncbi:hypothetical protein POG22_14045 [Geitlerinema sp. CS-897]|nr:hypothetical protein [Geitlerinema sp. CS-897]